MSRAWTMLGMAAGSAYLIVLPYGHVAAFRSLALVLAIAAAIALWQPPDRRLIPVLGAFAVWLAAACLSLLSTHDLSESLDALGNDLLRSLVVLMVFYTLTRQLAAYRVWVTASALGFIALSALAVGAYALHGEWRVYYVPPLQDYATSAITVLPLLAGHLAFKVDRGPAVMLVATAVVAMLAAGYLTMSRAFWLVVILGISVGIALHALRHGRFRKRWLLVVLGAMIIGLALATTVATKKARSLLDFEDRSPIYAAVLDKIRSNPVTGTGFGHETDKAWYAAALPGTSVFHAHNIVLSYIDQMGFFGLAALVAIFGAPGVLFARALRDPQPEAASAAICGLVLLVCVFVRNNLDYFFVKHNLWLFFAHLGIYLGVIARSTPASAATDAKA